MILPKDISQNQIQIFHYPTKITKGTVE